MTHIDIKHTDLPAIQGLRKLYENIPFGADVDGRLGDLIESLTKAAEEDRPPLEPGWYRTYFAYPLYWDGRHWYRPHVIKNSLETLEPSEAQKIDTTTATRLIPETELLPKILLTGEEVQRFANGLRKYYGYPFNREKSARRPRVSWDNLSISQQERHLNAAIRVLGLLGIEVDESSITVVGPTPPEDTVDDDEDPFDL